MDAKPDDTAAYIHDLSRNLADLAREHGFPCLSLILELAAIEALTAREQARDGEQQAA